MDQYGDLIRTHVNVVVEPLNIIRDPSENKTAVIDDVGCALTLHRNRCFDQNNDLSPPIDENEPISWNTKICFRWHCQNTSNLLKFLISSCYLASTQKLVQLAN